MKKLLFFILFLICGNIYCQQKIGIKYLNIPYANIHQNPSRYSNVLATISCNHPVQIVSEEKKTNVISENMRENWVKLKTGEYVGYIFDNYLSDKRVSCYQDNYIKFFEGLELSLTDMYYWARLYDMYLSDKSQVK